MGKTIFMGSKAELFPRQENQGSYIWCQEEIDNAVAKLQLIAIELQWVNGFFAVALRICACGSYGTKITQLTDLMSHSTNETLLAGTPHLLY